MRGEQSTSATKTETTGGSSPHARGTESSGQFFSPPERIIPACAGNRLSRPAKFWLFGDHPRMRGEQGAVPTTTARVRGSSPHARGTDTARALRLELSRIIPACAGNSARDIAAADAVADHPRMRGEQSMRWKVGPGSPGSSPHARGTGRPDRGAAFASRIIPACAGNRSQRWNDQSTWADHPRMRGEQADAKTYRDPFGGSSPHARGTVQLVDHRILLRRIIPACAGNSAALMITWRADPDHPRMRGEQFPHG